MDQLNKYLKFKKEAAKETLKIVDQFQQTGRERSKKRTSNIDIVFDVLQSAGHPLHISNIIRLVSQEHGVELNRGSIVSAKLYGLPAAVPIGMFGQKLTDG
jgi:hypothetical protein